MTTPLSLVHLQDPGRKVRLSRRQEVRMAAQSRSKSGPVRHHCLQSARKVIRTVGCHSRSQVLLADTRLQSGDTPVP